MAVIIGTNADGKPTLQFDEQEAFAPEEGRKYTSTENGILTVYELKGGNIQSASMAQAVAVDEEALSPAMVRLRERAKRRGGIIQPIILKDGDVTDTWFIRRFGHVDEIAVAASMGSQGYTALDLSTPEAQEAYILAVLNISVCKSETDPGPFFENLADVKAWFTEPGLQSVTVALFNQTLALNPELMPTFKKKAAG